MHKFEGSCLQTCASSSQSLVKCTQPSYVCVFKFMLLIHAHQACRVRQVLFPSVECRGHRRRLLSLSLSGLGIAQCAWVCGVRLSKQPQIRKQRDTLLTMIHAKQVMARDANVALTTKSSRWSAATWMARQHFSERVERICVLGCRFGSVRKTMRTHQRRVFRKMLNVWRFVRNKYSKSINCLIF